MLSQVTSSMIFFLTQFVIYLYYFRFLNISFWYYGYNGYCTKYTNQTKSGVKYFKYMYIIYFKHTLDLFLESIFVTVGKDEPLMLQIWAMGPPWAC